MNTISWGRVDIYILMISIISRNLNPRRTVNVICFSTIHPWFGGDCALCIFVKKCPPPTKRTISNNEIVTICHKKNVPITIIPSVLCNKNGIICSCKWKDIFFAPFYVITKYEIFVCNSVAIDYINGLFIIIQITYSRIGWRKKVISPSDMNTY